MSFTPVRCTGYEETGYCYWCGGEFKTKRQKHYCSKECSHEYDRHFEWSTAAKWAKERAHHRCMECGIKESDIPMIAPNSMNGGTSGYRVHHIVPVNGADRWYNPLNVPCNLIALCHACHMEWHRIAREYERRLSGLLVPKLCVPGNQGVFNFELVR